MMEYVYAALLLHSAKQEISEASVKKVLSASGYSADDMKIKALLASLKEVNIDDAIAKAAIAPVAASGSSDAGKKEEKAAPEEAKKTEEEAAQGLAGLFG